MSATETSEVTSREMSQKRKERILDWLNSNGLDVEAYIENHKLPAPQNAIEAIQQEIYFHDCVMRLMDLLMDGYRKEISGSWWIVDPHVVALTAWSGRDEVMVCFEEIIDSPDHPLSEETGYDRMRWSEGAVESLKHLLQVVSEQALACDFLNSKRSLHRSVPSEMFPGLSYHIPASWEEGGNPGKWKVAEPVLRELAEHSLAKYCVTKLDELRNYYE